MLGLVIQDINHNNRTIIMAKDPRKKELQAKFYKTTQEKKCSKKRRFATENSAASAGSSMNKLSPYKCRYCNYWHLTSSGPPIE